MDQKEYQSLILGALLHDIGKFMQRAEVALSEQSEKMEGTICPVYKGTYSHKHVLWTNEFFEKFRDHFPIPVFELVTKNPVDTCANFASYHHNADTPLQTIVQEADRLSSGMDRLSGDIEDEIIGKDAYKRVRLYSIFEEVDLGNNTERQHQYRYELNSLLPDKEAMFPRLKADLNPPEGKLLVKSYEELWRDFTKSFMNLPKNNFNTFLNALISLLERYTWSIPSSTKDLPDISLFDHSKTTAAIASCLYEYHKDTNTINITSIIDRKLEKFILIGGDLSGIQKYIFKLSLSNIKGVSRLLRARSFYIGALGNVSAHFLLHEANIPLICNIMDAGGRFILLAPNTEGTKKTINNVYREISDWYRRTFGGDLVLNLDLTLELSGTDFKVENFSNILSRLNDRIEEKKHHKMREILVKENVWAEEKFLIEDLYRYEEGVCQSCDWQPATERIIEEGRERRICKQCMVQERMGRYLIKSMVIAYSKKIPSTKKYVPFFDGRYYLSFWEDKEDLKPEEFYLLEGIYKPGEELWNCGFKFLSNHVPIFQSEKEFEELCPRCDDRDSCEMKKEAGIHKSFECIATEGTKAEDGNVIGKTMLGVLKADVDRLGFIFNIGLEQKMSVSRYSTLSRMMNAFFSGYIETMLHREDYQNIYTVYAGGDDLLLLGDWQRVINFSKEMYDDFRAFTCKNDDITLSAGINTIKARFPIRRAADMADEFLESSKDRGRDRLTLFNSTVVWRQFNELMQFAEFLDRQLNDPDSKIKSSFIYRLLQYHHMFLSAIEDGKIEGLRFHSQMAYDVGRNIAKKDDKGNIVNIDEMKAIYKLYDLTKIDKSLMKNLKMPIFWVLYKNRGR